MAQYLGIFVLAVLATLFASVSLLMSRLARISRPTSAKQAAYECGIATEQVDAKQRFPVSFYLVAMIFIVFDIEIIFLFPWAVIFPQLGLFGLVEMSLFAVPVVVALVYLVSNGALDWGPAKRLREERAQNGGSERTTESTIRRVGAPGEAA